MMFRRKTTETFDIWYRSKKRKPLIIRGARQVGKTTLVREYAKDQGLELLEINLERNLQLQNLFAQSNVEAVLAEVYAINRKNLSDPARTLVFLDEIQAIPSAVQWLRYVYEERPELAVVAAGSLLEFALKDGSVSVPVGRVEYLWLYPMTFKEYLLAKRQGYLVDILGQWDLGKLENFPESTHADLRKLMREYFLVGGMPEVISAFIEDGPQGAMNTQSGLVESYLDDLAKYSSRHSYARLRRVFRGIPGLLGNRVKYAHLSAEDKSREIKDVLELLTIAGVVSPIYHSGASGLPLAAAADRNSFKLLFMDIGLAIRMLGLDWSTLSAQSDEQLINEGPLAEQFIGQEFLASSDPKARQTLHFWKREKAQSSAEIDYVIVAASKIVGVEVKSGPSGSMRSLHQFMLKTLKKNDLALRFDASKPNLANIKHSVLNSQGEGEAIEYRLLSLPLYMACESQRLLAEAL